MCQSCERNATSGTSDKKNIVIVISLKGLSFCSTQTHRHTLPPKEYVQGTFNYFLICLFVACREKTSNMKTRTIDVHRFEVVDEKFA